jgi:hypothetical protein
MQDRPTQAELLDAIAELLEGPALEATAGPLRHQIRVAGNLCRILEREASLGAAANAGEIQLLAAVLDDESVGRDTAALNAALAQRLRESDDAELEALAWPALVEVVRGKLSIAKPGHDAYDFSSEQSDDAEPSR